MNKEFPTQHSIVDKLMGAISHLSESEILKLIELFSRPSAGNTFSEMLRQHVTLKQLERQLYSETTPQANADTEQKVEKTEERKEPKAKPQTNVPKPKTNVPKPKTNVSKPKTNVSKPKTDVSKPKTDVSKPKTDVSKPKVEVSKPKVEVSASLLNDYANQLKKDSLLEVLPHVLSDRKVFPLIRDVIDIMNNVCGLTANQDAFQKSSRNRLIRHYIKQVSGMSKEKQKRLTKKFSDWLTQHPA